MKISEQMLNTFFLECVYPALSMQQKHDFETRYPHISLQPSTHCRALSDYPVLMLVSFTGTGKTTTLDTLIEITPSDNVLFRDDLPTRRELADFFVIPTAQVLLGDAVRAVSDRVQRFHYTRTFSQHITGGMATVYSQLQVDTSSGHLPFVSDGIRGNTEIHHTLANNPTWSVTELYVDIITRLQRLSDRQDRFDVANRNLTMQHIPQQLHTRIHNGLENGKLSQRAVVIINAEAQNYGTDAYPNTEQSPQFQQIKTEHLTPELVAQQLLDTLKVMRNYA